MLYGRRHTYTRGAVLGAITVLFIVAGVSALFLTRFQLLPYLTDSFVRSRLQRTAESYGLELQISEIRHSNNGLHLVGVSARHRIGGHQLDIDTMLLRLGAGSLLRPQSMLRSISIETMTLHLHEGSNGIVVPRRGTPEITRAGVGAPGIGGPGAQASGGADLIPASVHTELWDDAGLTSQAVSSLFRALSRLGSAPEIQARAVELTFSSDRSQSSVPWKAASIHELHLGGGVLAGEFSFVSRGTHQIPGNTPRLPDSATVQLQLGKGPTELHGAVSFSPELALPLGGSLSTVLSSTMNRTSNGDPLDLVLQRLEFNAGWITLEQLSLESHDAVTPLSLEALRLGHSEEREYLQIARAWESANSSLELRGAWSLARASLNLLKAAEFIEPQLNLRIDIDGNYRLPGATPLLTGRTTELGTDLHSDISATEPTTQDRVSPFIDLLTAVDRPLEVRVQNASVSVHDERHGTAHSAEVSLHDLDLFLERHNHSISFGTTGMLKSGSIDAGHWDIDLVFDGRELHALSIDLELPQIAVPIQLLGGGFIELVRDGSLVLQLSSAPHAGDSDSGTSWGGILGLRNAAFSLPFLAEETFTVADMSYEFALSYDAQAELSDAGLLFAWPDDRDLSAALGRITMRSGILTVGEVQMEFRPSLHGLFGLDGPPARADVDIELPPTSLQRILGTIPAPLLGELSGMRLGGDLAWAFQLEVPLDRPSRMEWRSLLNAPEFQVLYLPPAVDVFRLSGSFDHTIQDPGLEYERSVRIPPMRPVSNDWMRRNSGMTPEEVAADPRREAWFTRVPEAPARNVSAPRQGAGHRYVRLEEMSPWIPRAVLSGEDSWFFAHRGFDWPAIKRAFELNLRQGQVVVGASTISMQLMKNLYLNHDRVAARKLQEAFLVFLVEEVMQLPKERMLELYLNIVEFGPEVFGIYDAAQHYFGKTPQQLDLTEAVWLASILPSPKVYHRQFEHGEVFAWWLQRKEQYMASMLRRNRITQDQYDAEVSLKPRFRDSGT